MDTYLRISIHFCAFIACGGLGMGCAINVKPKVNSTAFVNASVAPELRIPQNAVLVLSDTFITYNHKLRRGLQPYNFYLGPSLEAYAMSVAESNFQSIQILREGKAPSITDADLILTPIVRKVDLTSFVTIFEKQHLTIDVEWTLKRKGEDIAIWITTFEGNADGSPASRKLVQDAITDLWKETARGFKKLHTLEALNKR